MKTKNDKKIKVGNPSSFIFAICLLLVVLGFITFIGYNIVYSVTRPEHRVRVTYTIYSNPPRQETGVYKICGSNFVSSVVPQNGAVYLYIRDGKRKAMTSGEQSVCIYSGLNDAKVNKIEIIE